MLSNVHSRIKSTALFLGLWRPDRRRYDRHAASRIMQLQRTLDVLLEAVLPQVVRLVGDDILGPVVVIVLALRLSFSAFGKTDAELMLAEWSRDVAPTAISSRCAGVSVSSKAWLGGIEAAAGASRFLSRPRKT